MFNFRSTTRRRKFTGRNVLNNHRKTTYFKSRETSVDTFKNSKDKGTAAAAAAAAVVVVVVVVGGGGAAVVGDNLVVETRSRVTHLKV
jgi:hypothetical protein